MSDITTTTNTTLKLDYEKKAWVETYYKDLNIKDVIKSKTKGMALVIGSPVFNFEENCLEALSLRFDELLAHIRAISKADSNGEIPIIKLEQKGI